MTDAERFVPYREVAAAVGDATRVVAVGAGTHAGIGGDVADATEVRVPAGIVAVLPADMTVTVRAGTTAAALATALADHDQECPLDPADDAATVGGILAAGLSGPRRLGLGPLRDAVLEVVMVLADGRIVRGGGPTVKNVTGYDVPRLAVGSLGTLGVLVEVTLRTRPRPRATRWYRTDGSAAEVLAREHAPTTVARDRAGIHVRLDGHPDDVAAERPGTAADVAPAPPDAAHRGRIAVAPGHLDALVADLDGAGLAWLAEYGVGTVHVGAGEPEGLVTARDLAHRHGGWMLREAGAPGLDPFGTAFPAAGLQRRIRAALDPTGKLAPGRVRATEPA